MTQRVSAFGFLALGMMGCVIPENGEHECSVDPVVPLVPASPVLDVERLPPLDVQPLHDFEFNLIGEWSFPNGNPYESTDLRIAPSNPPALAVYEDLTGYTDFAFIGELIAMGRATETQSSAYLSREMIFGSVTGRSFATLENPDGPFLAPTGWGELLEYQMPLDAELIDGWVAQVSSGVQQAAIAYWDTVEGGWGAYRIASITVDDVGRLERREITTTVPGAFGESLATAEGASGHCWAWCTWNGYSLVDRRCSRLDGDPFRPDALGSTTHWGTLALTGQFAAAETPIFTTREGDVVLQAVFESVPVDLIWVRGENNPPEARVVLLPDSGAVESAARVGNRIVVASRREGEPSHSLLGLELPETGGWQTSRWRPIARTDEISVCPSGRMRLIERPVGETWLVCHEPFASDRSRVSLFRVD